LKIFFSKIIQKRFLNDSRKKNFQKSKKNVFSKKIFRITVYYTVVRKLLKNFRKKFSKKFFRHFQNFPLIFKLQKKPHILVIYIFRNFCSFLNYKGASDVYDFCGKCGGDLISPLLHMELLVFFCLYQKVYILNWSLHVLPVRPWSCPTLSFEASQNSQVNIAGNFAGNLRRKPSQETSNLPIWWLWIFESWIFAEK